MEDQLSYPSLQLTVEAKVLALFTTVLQSGIEIKTAPGQTLAHFLNTFPGFTSEYLSDTVQTVFLNGSAVDDLALPLTGQHPVVALSAAMPGLAGAIFRRNSFHSALRTETKSLQSSGEDQESVLVTLKLFNSIARDRGKELLQTGVCLQAGHLLSFLTKRPTLIDSIVAIEFTDKIIDFAGLVCALKEISHVNLKIICKNG